ncbi:PcfJ domain-containing protein [Alloalcanivorax xenomutans]|uniref:PcfJ domain-containing protein n=1 Tax=Alloalcanivorax xenomutans TaxID=1094342 RepID=A0A9Q3W8B9_9GAMM|nr:PcfJ domain-containing protein [Alloalcanivorax xenomutans]MCE7510993.1 PcfJ domain-containing protein [Alloalcanivorax xenomutans]
MSESGKHDKATRLIALPLPVRIAPRYAATACRVTQYLAQTDITRVFRRHRDDHAGTASLTLFGLWRLTVPLELTQNVHASFQEGAINSEFRTERYDLEQRRWVDDDALHAWPSLQLLPVQTHSGSLRFDWIAMQQQAIQEVHRQAMYHTAVPRRDQADCRQQLDTALGLEALLGNPADLAHVYEHSRRLLQRAWAAVRTLKAFKKALWQHIDRDALALAARMVERYRPLTLHHYLRVATHREAAQRIARERPNLLPLLPVIHERHWHRPDLFARARWVRGDRATTVVDRLAFYVPNTPPSHRFHSVDSRGVFLYLTRSPLSVVRRLVALWQEDGWRRSDTERLIRLFQALTPQDPRAFARLLPLLAVFQNGHQERVSVFHHDMFRLQPPGQRDARTAHGFPLEYERLLRAWVQAQLALWRDAGYRALLRQLPTARHRLSSVLDWLAAEGLPQGLPTKTMHWDALHRRSQAWHERRAAALRAFYDARERPTGHPVPRWSAPVARIDDRKATGFQAQALLTPQALAEEGRALHHCVAVYADDCAGGQYLVYALTGPERATLGLIRTVQGGRTTFVIDQIQGPCNQPVSRNVKAFAQQVVQALTAAANTHGTLKKHKKTASGR